MTPPVFPGITRGGEKDGAMDEQDKLDLRRFATLLIRNI